MGSVAPMRLGVVGSGVIAQAMALFAKLNRRIKIEACCDISEERGQRFARRFRIPRRFTSYSEMLDNAPLDAVYLAIPHHLHHDMIAAAIEKGRHCLVEKPVTRTLEEGIHIRDLAKERGVSVGVNYQYRYDSAGYALARAVQAGALGQVTHARINVPWHRGPEYFDKIPWHGLLAHAGGGTLITQGSHFLDLALWAISSRPVSAVGYARQAHFKQVEVEDLAQGIVALENGALVSISSTMIAHKGQAVSLEVYGDKGIASYTDRPWPRLRFQGIRVRRLRPPCWGVHALQRSLEGFRAWVMAGSPYLIPAEQALPALASVEAIYRSSQTGRREDVAACASPNIPHDF